MSGSYRYVIRSQNPTFMAHHFWAGEPGIQKCQKNWQSLRVNFRLENSGLWTYDLECDRILTLQSRASLLERRQSLTDIDEIRTQLTLGSITTEESGIPSLAWDGYLKNIFGRELGHLQFAAIILRPSASMLWWELRNLWEMLVGFQSSSASVTSSTS